MARQARGRNDGLARVCWFRCNVRYQTVFDVGSGAGRARHFLNGIVGLICYPAGVRMNTGVLLKIIAAACRTGLISFQPYPLAAAMVAGNLAICASVSAEDTGTALEAADQVRKLS